ncbi:hypothetical protein TNCV_1882291 [Trichonephila clavipes]|nr:hypothetical protein TNCV_1882291 [Trichonephila clavipes]
MFQWHTRISEDRKVVYDNECSGRSMPSSTGQCLSFLFNINDISLIEWIPQGQTVKWQYYTDVLGKFRERVRKKTPDLQSSNV